jgi:glycosyltransferase involved in cell wall biosynthesis
MSNPLVSVIIPAYNAQDFIAQTIESVIKQTYPHWELLVVDDGSTDGTRESLQKYVQDSRIKYLYQENQERSVARNHGIKSAKGKYIAFLDADDLWLPDKLKIQVEYLESHPEMGLCFTRYLFVDSQDTILGWPNVSFIPTQDQFYQLLQGNFIPNSTVMVLRTIFDKVGLFDEALPAFGSEDWDMWLRVARRYSIHFINQPLAFYRIHTSNTSLERMRLSAEAVLQKIFADPTLPTYIAQYKSRVYACIYCGFSETCFRLNQRQQAWDNWRRAVTIYPGILVTKRGLLATLKLLSPYSLIALLAKLRLWRARKAPFKEIKCLFIW